MCQCGSCNSTPAISPIKLHLRPSAPSQYRIDFGLVATISPSNLQDSDLLLCIVTYRQMNDRTDHWIVHANGAASSDNLPS